MQPKIANTFTNIYLDLYTDVVFQIIFYSYMRSPSLSAFSQGSRHKNLPKQRDNKSFPIITN